MARWAPDTRQRLQVAALELFTARGYDETTTADIAAAVGVTERTFFRHFADKREVLFQNQDSYVKSYVDAIQSAPADQSALELITAALHSAAQGFPEERRAWARSRRVAIERHDSLAERDRSKSVDLARAIASALQARGIDPIAARLAAESATTVFGIAFEEWTAADDGRSLDEIVSATLAHLRDLGLTR